MSTPPLEIDPHTQPSFSLSNRLRRLLWGILYTLLFRYSPRPFHAWRSFLLRCCGASLGESCHIYPKSIIWAPWNLICEDLVAIADEANIYNPDKVYLGSHCIISQAAYLCGASHDYESAAFPLISAPITVGPYAWICARATLQMGVTVGEGAILGLGAVATKDLEPWFVYAGIPARKIKRRENTDVMVGKKLT
jgi:putative colanic acid biosynthesis acetyltransferase WcaF